MDQPTTEQKPTESAKKTQGLGWIWVAAIVIVVAGVLFITQKKAPNNEANTTNEAVAPEVKDIPVTVVLGSVPKSVPTGSVFGLDWKVDASEQTFVSVTGLAWDSVSHSGDLGTDVTPSKAGYPELSHAYDGVLTAVPGSFEDNLKLPLTTEPGAMYLRVFATVADKTYWSQEYIIPSRAPGSATNGGS